MGTTRLACARVTALLVVVCGLVYIGWRWTRLDCLARLVDRDSAGHRRNVFVLRVGTLRLHDLAVATSPHPTWS